jgi:hypothetical protein
MAIRLEDLPIASPVIAQEVTSRLERVLTPPERHQFIDREGKGNVLEVRTTICIWEPYEYD